MAQHRLGSRIAGSARVVLSLCSIVLCLGAAGAGWAVSGATLVVASLCAPLIGRHWLAVCLVLTFALLVTFGPLGVYDSATFDPDWVMAAMTFGPIMIALVALLVPFWKKRFGRASR